MFVKPTGQLGTTIIETVGNFQRSIVVSDLTVKSLNELRHAALAGHLHTIVISDMAKLYKRHGSVSSNIEGVIMSMIGEGFRKPAFGDQRVESFPARVAVIGAMTPKFYDDMQGHWVDSGFYRRCLFSLYRFRRPELLDKALIEGHKYALDGHFAPVPMCPTIPFSVDAKESQAIYNTLKVKDDKKTTLIIAQRIVSVLKYLYRREANPSQEAMKVWNEFSETFGSGAIIDL